MHISYKPLWHTLLERDMRKEDLRLAAGMTTNMITEPITAGIFVSIVAWASYQRSEDETPYWRTLKANGELNAKYPNGIEAQKEKLEAEGHTIIQKGRKNVRYYVKDYENSLFDLK